jgi:hypothetical protein
MLQAIYHETGDGPVTLIPRRRFTTSFGEAGNAAKVGVALVASIALGVGLGWGVAVLGLNALTRSLRPH